MGLRVLFVSEGAAPEAGSVSVLLPGLVKALSAAGVASETVSDGRSDAVDASMGRADLVHVFGWGYGLAQRAAQIARRSHTPCLISPFGGLSTGPYRHISIGGRLRAMLRENPIVRSAAGFLAVSDVERDALQTRFGGKVRTLPLGVHADTDALPPTGDIQLPPPLPGRCLLMLGPIDPIEGVVPLLKAVGEMGTFSDGWHVALAGPAPGDWRAMLEAAVRRKGAEDRVQFAPAPDIATQRAWLDRAAILAAPALHPRAPVSVLQAMATGVPVLATTCVIPPGLESAACICEPTRAGIKSGLLALFRASDEERRAAADRAREAVRKRFDWSAVAPDYAALYDEVCTRSRSTRTPRVIEVAR